LVRRRRSYLEPSRNRQTRWGQPVLPQVDHDAFVFFIGAMLPPSVVGQARRLPNHAVTEAVALQPGSLQKQNELDRGAHAC
jgi:hypothetical protein